MQAPTPILIILAQLQLAMHHLQRALEKERDNAQLDYERLTLLPGGVGSDHTAMLLELADERGYHARRALRVAFGSTEAFLPPTPEDLGYAAVVQE
jgi:hypothetical protein